MSGRSTPLPHPDDIRPLPPEVFISERRGVNPLPGETMPLTGWAWLRSKVASTVRSTPRGRDVGSA